MYLSELSELIAKLKVIKNKVNELRREIRKLEEKYQQSVRESERLRKLERITGKKLPKPEETVFELLRQRREDLREAEMEKRQVYEKVGRGLAELTINLDLSLPTPEVQEGKAIFRLNENNAGPALDFIKELIGCEGDVLEIDGVKILPSEIIVEGIKSEDEAIDKLSNVTETIQSFGKAIIGKCPEDINRIVDSLKSRKPFYVKVWEILASKRKITYKEIYEIMGIKEKEEERKKVRAFLSELRKRGLIVCDDNKQCLSVRGMLVKLCYERIKLVSLRPQGLISEVRSIKRKMHKGTLNMYFKENYA